MALCTIHSNIVTCEGKVFGGIHLSASELDIAFTLNVNVFTIDMLVIGIHFIAVLAVGADIYINAWYRSAGCRYHKSTYFCRCIKTATTLALTVIRGIENRTLTSVDIDIAAGL